MLQVTGDDIKFQQSPRGFHSVKAVATPGWLAYDEYVIYRKSQVVEAFLPDTSLFCQAASKL
jgi:hypothetical protein